MAQVLAARVTLAGTVDRLGFGRNQLSKPPPPSFLWFEIGDRLVVLSSVSQPVFSLFDFESSSCTLADASSQFTLLVITAWDLPGLRFSVREVTVNECGSADLKRPNISAFAFQPEHSP